MTATFTITVTEPAPTNAPPVITNPGDKTYERGETVTAFGISVSDADQDTVTVTLSGLPSGLSYTNGQVQGTVADDATTQDYTVTISVDDGTNTAVTATFTITVTEPAPTNAPPVITNPGDKTYERGETITAFGITVSDADEDTVTVTLSGLPSGLSYTNDQVQGTVVDDAATQDYTVTISADDGTNAAVTATFTITVTEAEAQAEEQNVPPVITESGRQDLRAGGDHHGVRDHGERCRPGHGDGDAVGPALGVVVHERPSAGDGGGRRDNAGLHRDDLGGRRDEHGGDRDLHVSR